MDSRLTIFYLRGKKGERLAVRALPSAEDKALNKRGGERESRNFKDVIIK